MSAWNWVSLSLGSLFGFFFFAGAGLGKLLPGHPLYKEMVPGFDKVMGPYFGLPGGCLRTLIGLSYVAAGAGLLGGLWGEFLGKFDKDLLALDQALLICAPIGVIVIHLAAIVYHLAVEGNPGPCPVFITVMGILLYARLQMTPFATLDAQGQLVVKAFTGVGAAGLVLAFLLRAAAGAPLEDLKKEKAKLDAEKQQATERGEARLTLNPGKPGQAAE